MTRGVSGSQLACWLGLLMLAVVVQAQDEADGAGAANALPEPALRVELTPKEITVGDRVTSTLILDWPAGAPDTEPRFPAWQESWGKADLVEVGPVERQRGPDGRTVFSQRVQMTVFETGETKLPPVLIAIPVAGETLEIQTPDDLVLTVKSVLPEGEEAVDPRPAIGPQTPTLGRAFWWTTALLGAVCLLLAPLVARRHPEAFGGLLARPRLPPFEELTTHLGRLDAGQGSEQAHTAMSLALRTYLGRATGLQALERTTSEIQRQLRQARDPLTPALAQRILALLRQCDEAKFIRDYDVPRSTIEDRLRETTDIARTVHEHLQPDDPEGDDTTGTDPDGARG